MSGRTHNAVIIAKKNNSDAEKAAIKVASLLRNKKLNVFCVSPLKVDGCKTVESEEIARIHIEFMVAIGGDGTTLRAFRVVPVKAPLMSVNIGGHRGILSEIDTNSLAEGVHAMLDGKCDVDCRMRIQATIGTENLPPALNDILVTRKNITRTPVITARIMNDQISQRMDGLLISTPTGSTGHSLSIGGPVIYERMNCILLCPIAPVNRLPLLVVPPETIYIESNLDSNVVIDGQESYELPPGQPIKLVRYVDDACFFRLKKKGLRQIEKLGF